MLALLNFGLFGRMRKGVREDHSMVWCWFEMFICRNRKILPENVFATYCDEWFKIFKTKIKKIAAIFNQSADNWIELPTTNGHSRWCHHSIINNRFVLVVVVSYGSATNQLKPRLHAKWSAVISIVTLNSTKFACHIINRFFFCCCFFCFNLFHKNPFMQFQHNILRYLVSNGNCQTCILCWCIVLNELEAEMKKSHVVWFENKIKIAPHAHGVWLAHCLCFAYVDGKHINTYIWMYSKWFKWHMSEWWKCTSNLHVAKYMFNQ